MKNLKFKLLVLFILLIVSTNTSFCDSWDYLQNNQTINELNNWILELNKNSKELNFELFLLNQDLKLSNFFIDNLTKDDIKNIQLIVNSYIEQKNKIEALISEKAKNFKDTIEEKKLLLNEKRDFYKKLIPYIKDISFDDYLDYIAQDVKILKEKTELDEKIIIKQEIINNKIASIEEKIKEHKIFLDKKFEELIIEKLNLRIESLKNNENFILLSVGEKKEVINRIILKIKVSLDNINSIPNKTDILMKKIEVYEIIIDELEDIRDNIK